MDPLSCERCQDLLGDYAEGVLPGDAAEELERHVRACAGCTRLLRDYRALPAILRRYTDASMPYEAEARLRRLIARERPDG